MLNTLLSLRNRHLFILDGFFLLLTPIFALSLRLDDLGNIWHYAAPLFRYTLLALAIKVAVFYAIGLYQRYWRYASIEELVLILKAVGGTGVAITLFFFAFHDSLLNLPRSLPLIDALLTVAVVAAPRFTLRLLARRHVTAGTHQRRALIVGAGDAGQMLAREMRQNPNLGYDLVGFVDDDPQKQGLRMRGVSILGGREHIPDLVREYRVQQLVIAIPSASGAAIRQIINICNQAGVQTRILPGFADMLNGDVRVGRLRSVQINDLLRREPIEIDIAAVRKLVHGKRVLITGAGGSIGRELCRQIWRCNPAALILLGHGENSIFEITQELGGKWNGGSEKKGDATLIPIIADIRFPDRIRAVFEQQRPQIVFHAAAHKHVPLMEANPAEAITNNILGTGNVLAAALAADVERFVMISTDKAVNPTSIMGASKRAAELLVHRAARQCGKPYVAVRFGNVLGSRGSVVLTFQKQIKAGGPITVTHRDVKRYIMTIPEAVQLLLQAAVLGTGGEVFVLDMGKPIKIVDLARDMIELSGLEMNKDIAIEFTGLRSGEKLFEELFIEGEEYERTCHEKIFIAANAISLIPDDLDDAIKALAAAAAVEDKDAIFGGLRALIPEFQPVGESVLGNGQETGTDDARSSPPAVRLSSLPAV